MVRNLDKADRIQIFISYFIKLIILGFIIFNAVKGEWFMVFWGSIFLLASFMPLLLERNLKVHLPVEIDFMIALMLLLFALGSFLDFYNKIHWWDDVSHYLGGLLIGFIGFFMIYTFHYIERLKTGTGLIILFTFSFSLAMGAVWEIFEFSMDYFFGYDMMKGLVNTATDLILDAFGALVAAIFGGFYIKNSKPGFVGRLTKKFLEWNKK